MYMNIRMIVGDNCNGCMVCFNVCPIKCISFVSDSEGFFYPQVANDICVHCSMCQKYCPILHPLEADKSSNPHTYAVINKDEFTRMKSSSGGVFSLLAEYVLQRDGVVFGAYFDEKWDVVHGYIDSHHNLYRLRGSKYVQSYIGNAYELVKDFLKKRKLVLFSGTPCQIGGLCSFLGRSYDNLITVDFICHGVPSPLVWKRYKVERSQGKIIKSIFFRSKKISWERFLLELHFHDLSIYQQPIDKDVYLKGFLTNLFLRPSCHKCRFKSLNRLSDFTLADFWGIDRILPDVNDHKGTSLVFCHTAKSEIVLKKLDAIVIPCSISKREILQENSAMLKSVVPHPHREKFFKELTQLSMPIDKLISIYTKEAFGMKVYKYFVNKLYMIRKICR